MVPTSRGLSSSVWKGTKAEFCITVLVVTYTGKLARILPSENRVKLCLHYRLLPAKLYWPKILGRCDSWVTWPCWHSPEARHAYAGEVTLSPACEGLVMGSRRPGLCCDSPTCRAAFWQGYVGVWLLLECFWGLDSCMFLKGCFQIVERCILMLQVLSHCPSLQGGSGVPTPQLWSGAQRLLF